MRKQFALIAALSLASFGVMAQTTTPGTGSAQPGQNGTYNPSTGTTSGQNGTRRKGKTNNNNNPGANSPSGAYGTNSNPNGTNPNGTNNGTTGAASSSTPK